MSEYLHFGRRRPRLRPAVVLVAAAALACEPDPQATVILAGGPVWGLTRDVPAQAIALAGDSVLRVGTRQAVEALAGSRTVRVELAGATVLPAFTDHHVHVLDLGLAVLNREEGEERFLFLEGISSLEELEGRVRERAATLPPGAWILGQGWSQASWGTEALPDSDVLDRAAPDHPVLLTRTDAHAAWANRRALQAAGIGRATRDPPGGRIVRRPDGSATGVLLERAVEPVWAHVPRPDVKTLVQAFRRGAEALAERGVVRAYDAGFLTPPGIVDLGADYRELLDSLLADDRANPLPVDISLMVAAPSPLAEAVLGATRPSSPRVRVTHIKLFADGALGSRSAALTHPYADDPRTRGVVRMSSDEILAWSVRALDAGLDVATHAIGDAAVAAALDAYDALLESRPGLDGRRLRIEHFSYASDADFARAVDLGIALSIQSTFNSPAGASPTFGEMRVGAEGADRVYAWRRLADAGALLFEGTDLYALPGPPLLPIHAALTAHNAVGIEGDGPAGRMDAFRMATRYLPPGGRPPVRGRLARGTRADLVVLSLDPLRAEPDALLDARVLATYRGGRLVYGTIGR